MVTNKKSISLVNVDFPYKTKSYTESNFVLRKIWTIFDNICVETTGSHNGWQYNPCDLSGGLFFIGSNNVASENYAIIDESGGLEKLSFKIYSEYYDKVMNSLSNFKSFKSYPLFLDFVFDNLTEYKMNECVFNSVYIYESNKKIHFNLRVDVFGSLDAKKIASDFIPLVCSIVFSYFHKNLKYVKYFILESKSLKNTNNYAESIDEWFDYDEIPVDREIFRVNKSFMTILDLVSSNKFLKNNNLVRIVNSARNTKLAHDMLLCTNTPNDISLYRSYIDGILMSALENLSTINAKKEKCEACGQIKYAISRSVSDYCKENFNEFIMQQANKMYKIRSKLFHENKIVIDEYCGISFPLLIEDKEKRDLNKDCYANDKKRNIFQQMFNGNVYNFVDYLLYLVRKELDKELN